MNTIQGNFVKLYNQPECEVRTASQKPKAVESSQNLTCNLNNVPQNIHGKQLAFGRIKYMHKVSRRFAEKYHFPAHVKVPDGFKYTAGVFNQAGIKRKIDKKGICSTINESFEQITVIDRKKDKDLQEIIQNFKKKVPKWKKEFARFKAKNHWRVAIDKEDDYICEKTIDFINSYSKKFPFDKIVKKGDKKFCGKETLLGEIIKSGFGICRHNSFLNKLLLDNIGIKTSVRYGSAYTNSLKKYSNHAYNTAKLKNGKQLLDANLQKKFSFSKKDDLAKYTDHTYQRLSKLSGIESRIIDLQPGKSIKIGIKRGKLVPVKQGDKTKPVLKLIWTDKNKFELKILDKNKSVKTNWIENKEHLIVIDKNTFLEIGSNSGDKQYVSIYPDLIRANFIRNIYKAIVKVKDKFPKLSDNFSTTQLVQANPKLSLDALEIPLSSPAFTDMLNLLQK